MNIKVLIFTIIILSQFLYAGKGLKAVKPISKTFKKHADKKQYLRDKLAGVLKAKRNLVKNHQPKAQLVNHPRPGWIGAKDATRNAHNHRISKIQDLTKQEIHLKKQLNPLKSKKEKQYDIKKLELQLKRSNW